MATTITVESDTLERFNRLKENTGDDDIPELSSDQFLKSLLDTWEENGESIYGEPSFAELSNALEGKFLSEKDAKEIIECENKDVLNRLDDLETHIDGRFDEVTRP